MYLQRWHGWCHVKLLPSGRVLCTPCNPAPCHFMQSHIRQVLVCLAVTCQLHFWQSDWDLLHATAVTQGWNGYWNKSQHIKLTLPREENSPTVPAGIWTQDLSVTNLALPTTLSLLRSMSDCLHVWTCVLWFRHSLHLGQTQCGPGQSTDWFSLFDWLGEWLIDWLIGSLMGFWWLILIGWSVGWLVCFHSLIDCWSWLICCRLILIGWLINRLTGCLVDISVNWLTGWLIN